MSRSSKPPVVFIPHGGGPMPLLGEPGHQPLVNFLRSAHRLWERPKAILVISAHWEAPRASLLGDDEPDLFYDYYGFPPEAYQLSYPAVNPPHWRNRIKSVLAAAGFDVDEIDGRGYDHGVFVPLLLMQPEADLPVLQLSLLQGLDPLQHIKLGEALQPLREEGVLILGSGLSFHNMRVFGGAMGGDDQPGRQFHDWLVEALTRPDLAPTDRYQQLVDWSKAPHARFVHPREEHLLPLHVCLGAAAGGMASIPYDHPLFGQRTVGVIWET